MFDFSSFFDSIVGSILGILNPAIAWLGVLVDLLSGLTGDGIQLL